jgi:hypothetical protein
MKLSLIFGIITFIIFTSLIVLFGMPILINSIQKPTPLIATIKLNNLCTVKDDTFIAVTSPYNRRAYFSNGMTRIRVMSDWKVRLETNDKYPNFKYDGIERSVSKNMVLTADCGTSPRLKGIFSAFKNEFN